jgi:peptide/nickel transport system substrate-binding protein
VPADNFAPIGLQYVKPLGLPEYSPDKARELLASTGLTPAQLTIDFYYPSNVSRPYMPDPQGIFEAIAANLEAVGFTIVPKTQPWSPDYLDGSNAGVQPLDILGITCQWAGVDNFLKVNYFSYVDGKPKAKFAYQNDNLQTLMNQAIAAPDAATAEGLWYQAEEELAKDLPIIPLVNSRPPAAARSYVQGFVGAGNLSEHLNTVWLDK